MTLAGRTVPERSSSSLRSWLSGHGGRWAGLIVTGCRCHGPAAPVMRGSSSVAGQVCAGCVRGTHGGVPGYLARSATRPGRRQPLPDSKAFAPGHVRAVAIGVADPGHGNRSPGMGSYEEDGERPGVIPGPTIGNEHR